MIQSVTVAMLIYKSADWLAFALEGLSYARNRTPYRTLVVGNDANDEVMGTGRVDVDFRNPDPSEYYLNRVYRAWNHAVSASETEYVALVNSDMYFSDYWLDELVGVMERDEKTIPCSILVESGRIPSAMPEYVRNLGLQPESFDRAAWATYSASIRQMGKTEPGRLFMPCLFKREVFLSSHGYPIGNITNPDGSITSGDRFLFDRLAAAGFRHVTALGSVVYHTQEGETRS